MSSSLRGDSAWQALASDQSAGASQATVDPAAPRRSVNSDGTDATEEGGQMATAHVSPGTEQDGMAETAAERAASIQKVIAATSGESASVKQAALQAVAGPIPPPTKSAADIAWVVLVCGLVGLLVLSLLALTHVIGTNVSDDKVVTVFTTSLAGLLGLFARPPGGS